MKAPHVDLDALAAEMGITPEKAAGYIREAVDAGLLTIIAGDDDTVTLQGTFPEEAITR